MSYQSTASIKLRKGLQCCVGVSSRRGAKPLAFLTAAEQSLEDDWQGWACLDEDQASIGRAADAHEPAAAAVRRDSIRGQSSCTSFGDFTGCPDRNDATAVSVEGEAPCSSETRPELPLTGMSHRQPGHLMAGLGVRCFLYKS